MSLVIIFLFQFTVGDYTQFGIAGALIFLIVMVLGVGLRALPSWKEVKLAEILIREKEAEARSAQAMSFGQLSDALTSMSNVLNSVAVEQRHATEDVRLLQRVNADVMGRTEETINQLVTTVSEISHRIDSIEKLVGKK